MENAAKALIIAAGVLVGVLVIAVGAMFFKSVRNYAQTTVFASKDQLDIEKFNTPFMKIVDSEKQNFDGGNSVENNINIGDIVSLMNYTRNINIQYKDIGKEKVVLKINDNNLDYYYEKDTSKYNENMHKLISKYINPIDKIAGTPYLKYKVEKYTFNKDGEIETFNITIK